MYYFISMGVKWLDINPNMKSIKVYRYGNPQEELFLACEIYKVADSLTHRYMIHTQIKDTEKLKQLLLETDAIEWSASPMFEAVHEKDIPVILEINKIKNKSSFTDGLYNQVWLPPEKREKVLVNVPPNMYIRQLTEDHVSRVNDTWRYKSVGSQEIVRDTIVVNYGLGLFRKPDNKLLAWNTLQHFAGLGMLYTEDDERGKGYGSLITLALTKYLIDIEVDPYACIRINNMLSMAVYTKLGFEITDKVTWIMTSKMSDTLKEL